MSSIGHRVFTAVGESENRIGKFLLFLICDSVRHGIILYKFSNHVITFFQNYTLTKKSSERHTEANLNETLSTEAQFAEHFEGAGNSYFGTERRNLTCKICLVV